MLLLIIISILHRCHQCLYRCFVDQCAPTHLHVFDESAYPLIPASDHLSRALLSQWSCSVYFRMIMAPRVICFTFIAFGFGHTSKSHGAAVPACTMLSIPVWLGSDSLDTRCYPRPVSYHTPFVCYNPFSRYRCVLAIGLGTSIACRTQKAPLISVTPFHTGTHRPCDQEH